MQTDVDKSDTAVTIKDFVNRLHVLCVDEVKNKWNNKNSVCCEISVK